MHLPTRLAEWRLDHPVSALAAYSTILFQAIYVIVGRKEGSSPFTISILINGFTVILSGFGGSREIPRALLHVTLNTFVILFAITTLRDGERFDGTYAVLCATAQSMHQVLLWRTGDLEGDSLLLSRENQKKLEELGSSPQVGRCSTYDNDSLAIGRRIIFQFGEKFQIDGALLLYLTLGTAITYRVFDFNLGFGLAFPSISALWCICLLWVANVARLRGRQVNMRTSIRHHLSSALAFSGSFVFAFSKFVDFGVEVDWWKVAFGATWLYVLCRLTSALCRYILHNRLFSCAACCHTDCSVDDSTDDVTTTCPWETCGTLYKTPAFGDGGPRPIFLHMSHQEGRDQVHRFFLGSEAFFEISRWHFVMISVFWFVLGVIAINISELQVGREHSEMISTSCKVLLFYASMVFVSISTDHTSDKSMPEPLSYRAEHNSSDLGAAMLASTFTAMVHGLVRLSVFMEVLSRLKMLRHVIPFLCLVTTPVLLAGLSNPSQRSTQEEVKSCDSDDPPIGSVQFWNGDWSIDPRLYLSSPQFRRLDLRVLLFGVGTMVFDFLWSRHSATYPATLKVTFLMTTIVLILVNFVPPLKTLETAIFIPAVMILVAMFVFQNSMGILDIQVEQLFNDLEHAPRPFDVVWWYVTWISILLSSVLDFNRKVPADNTHKEQNQSDDPLLARLMTQKTRFDLALEIRHSTLLLTIFLAFAVALWQSTWLIPTSTIVSSLIMLVFTVSLNFVPKLESKDAVRYDYVQAFALSASLTSLAVALHRHLGHTETRGNWLVGTSVALVTSRLFVFVLRVKANIAKARAKQTEEKPCNKLADDENTTKNGPGQADDLEKGEPTMP